MVLVKLRHEDDAPPPPVEAERVPVEAIGKEQAGLRQYASPARSDASVDLPPPDGPWRMTRSPGRSRERAALEHGLERVRRG